MERKTVSFVDLFSNYFVTNCAEKNIEIDGISYYLFNARAVHFNTICELVEKSENGFISAIPDEFYNNCIFSISCSKSGTFLKIYFNKTINGFINDIELYEYIEEMLKDTNSESEYSVLSTAKIDIII